MSEPDLHDDAVPPGLRIAGAWSWRLLAIAAALGVFGFLVAYLRLLVIPLLIATLLSALLIPLKNWLVRHRWPAGLAVAVTELGVIAVVGALIFLVVAQVVSAREGLNIFCGRRSLSHLARRDKKTRVFETHP